MHLDCVVDVGWVLLLPRNTHLGGIGQINQVIPSIAFDLGCAGFLIHGIRVWVLLAWLARTVSSQGRLQVNLLTSLALRATAVSCTVCSEPAITAGRPALIRIKVPRKSPCRCIWPVHFGTARFVRWISEEEHVPCNTKSLSPTACSITMNL